MIIEIGTSDFRTDAGKIDGLFIEPIKEYYDNLPNCRKENVAISNYEGVIDIYHIPISIIKRYNLPEWVRGCNSVNDIHPTIDSYGYSKYVVKNSVKVVRIKSLIDKYNIDHIDYLKIDTEGHDCIILNDFLDTCQDTLPTKIQFEANVLSSEAEVSKTVEKLESFNYICHKKKQDMICKLKLK